MRYDNDGIALGLALLSVLLLILALLNLWLVFAITTSLLMVTLLALAYSPHRQAPRAALASLFFTYLILFVAIAATDRSSGPLSLVLSLPKSTSFLIYGIWPLGFLFGVLYFLRFRKTVLPQERLDKFLSHFQDK